jgi:uncharacterized protein involved in exopolysaccharide biosynthesis
VAIYTAKRNEVYEENATDREATVARSKKAIRDGYMLDSWNKQGEAFRSLREDVEATILELRTT